ncbi:cobaltochelatase subunit CobN [Phocaeicola sp.]
MKKRQLLIGGTIALILIVGTAMWNLWFSSTKVAFINYQVISLGQISKANDNSFIKISELSTDNLDKLTAYDMVFINAMGLRITEEQRAQIRKAADNGLPILTTAATNPANKIISLDSIQTDTLKLYLGNGGRRNYRSVLNYVRKHIDGKLTSVIEPEAVVERSNDMIYHIDPKNPEEEEMGFNTVADYNVFLQKNGLLKEGAPRIIITGQMGEPTDLISKLEETGNVVYPIRNMRSFIQKHHIDSVQPSAVINMAHGRMGDYVVDYLTRQDIPLFAPLNVNRLVEEWEDDKMGMNGGFLSQSVVTPEIDGAIRPFALFGHYKDEDGLQQAYAIPERLETFAQTVNNYISLQRKPNSDKRVAIYYYKGPGQNALTAGGMEVGPSLYNLLIRMKKEGYKVEGLPASSKELERMIQAQGAVFGSYAEGAFGDFMKNGNPELITKEEYEGWIKQSIRPEKYAEVVAANGEFPGDYMSTEDGRLGVARLQFGNVVLLPQNAAGKGDNSFKVVHGTDAAPPHTYIASYLWTQFGFKADALIHFGTHGSLEFTPKKQVALSSNDWPDRLVGALPHFYIYSIGNVGEGMIAKRRSYAGLQSYLTPPFLESSVRGIYRELTEAIKTYNNNLGAGANETADAAISTRREADLNRASLAVKALTVKLGIHRELGLDSLLTTPYTEDEVARVENFAEELANEKITGQLYTMGVPYEQARITSSVYAMATEPVAYSLLALDKLRNRADGNVEKHKALFTLRYLTPARELVTRLLANPALGTDELICRTAGITPADLAKAREIDKSRNAPQGMMAMMMAMADEAPAEAKAHADMGGMKKGGDAHPDKKVVSDAMKERMKEMAKGMDPQKAMQLAKKMGASPEALKKMEEGMKTGDGESEPGAGHPGGKTGAAHAEGMMKAMMGKKKEYTKEEVNFALAVMEVERTIKNVGNYKIALLESPEKELASMMNAMNGGYTQPSPGGDPVANPNTLPTGRNLYAINAEATPSESAWEKGIQLANNTIDMYKKRHNDSIPRKVSYTLWSGEFIETEGATIAQILYMLGVEPIRDAFGRVTDLKLIPSAELGRPRIDVVVQTSGQLRDIAASRLFLINRAVEMAAAATDDQFENQVYAGVVEAERVLTEKGLTPKDAREISTFRVFGGVNGGYGTGIQGMVQSGDRWEDEKEIADVYLNNMGAFYGSEKNWETVRQFAFEAALTRTDAVIQPRQSNTWGALSLDHVYEFMGGMNLAVRNVTGKDPDAYLSDYRNRNNVRMQEVKEAIGVESRTTIFNPTYIKEKMKGEAGGASSFAEIVQNTYGWNVMKPKAIDKEMWDEIYNVYVKDKFDLGIQDYFETQNPAALEEMTAVMMETARKGMWKASDQQLADIAKLHTELVNKYKPSCSGFVCDNAKLRQFIASKTDAQTAAQYKESISRIREAAAANDKKGMVMKKEEVSSNAAEEQTNTLNNAVVGVVVLIAIVVLVMVVRRRRKKMQE